MESNKGVLEKWFHLKENHTDAKTEVIAGITTFMTMAYILAVNPNVLGASGMDSGAVFTATALAAMVGTLMMALFANYPFVLAPGMGLNAYFAYTVVLQMGYSWEMALAAGNLQLHPDESEICSFCRYRSVYRLHRFSERKDRSRQCNFSIFIFL